jgi:hypothetical protein
VGTVAGVVQEMRPVSSADAMVANRAARLSRPSKAPTALFHTSVRWTIELVIRPRRVFPSLGQPAPTGRNGNVTNRLVTTASK